MGAQNSVVDYKFSESFIIAYLGLLQTFTHINKCCSLKHKNYIYNIFILYLYNKYY